MDITLLKKYVDDFNAKKNIYDKIYEYYRSNTDAMKNYKMLTDRSENKINTNYLKKFVNEEVAYVVGNQITYSTKELNANIINDIELSLGHWSFKHEINLAIDAVLFGEAYEFYYQDKENFSCMILNPRNSYIIYNEYNKPAAVLYFYKKAFDDKSYMDLIEPFVATTYDVYSLAVLSTKRHIFDEVPIGIAKISKDAYYDTLYTDLKGLQDAYETNFSDISNEISDFRQAYLVLTGIDIKDEDAPKLKKLGIMKFQNSEGKAQWLIKNINDAFINNTLARIKEDMYEITGHINTNEKLSSNTSSLALRTRMISLDNKCKFNESALNDCVGRDRIKFLFKFLDITQNKVYDYRNVKAIFTVSVPQDDLMMSQIVSQIPEGIISKETARSRFSFIDDAEAEKERVEKEEEAQNIGSELLGSLNADPDPDPTGAIKKTQMLN